MALVGSCLCLLPPASLLLLPAMSSGLALSRSVRMESHEPGASTASLVLAEFSGIRWEDHRFLGRGGLDRKPRASA